MDMDRLTYRSCNIMLLSLKGYHINLYNISGLHFWQWYFRTKLTLAKNINCNSNEVHQCCPWKYTQSHDKLKSNNSLEWQYVPADCSRLISRPTSHVTNELRSHLNVPSISFSKSTFQTELMFWQKNPNYTTHEVNLLKVLLDPVGWRQMKYSPSILRKKKKGQ